jgi:dihydrofolate reductase
MRPLIVTEFVSLDGVMEAPGGEPGYAHAGWVGDYFSDELGEYKGEEQEAAETLLLGRRTYEGFYGAWPGRTGAMADKINTMEKFVVSASLATIEWETASRLGSPLVAAVTELKAREGGPILVAGSRTLAQALLREGLVDELHLQVFPVILGSGMRLYPDSPDRLNLELVESRPVPNGVVLQTYRTVAA